MIDNVAIDSSSGCAGDARNCRAIAKRQRVVRGAVMCLALCVGTLRMLGSNEQQAGADSGAAQRSGMPAIAAKPEHVTLSGGSGSTEIQWNTGNGSIGFVFVKGADQKSVLFATGPKGSQVAPWIRTGSYVFNLYSDTERQMLL